MRFRKPHWWALAIGFAIELLFLFMAYIVYAARPYAPLWIESLAKGTQQPSLHLIASQLRCEGTGSEQIACFLLLCLAQGIIYASLIYLLLTTFRHFSHAEKIKVKL